MDFQTFFSIFERCKTERNGEGLAEILKDSRKYFQNISGNESGYVLATLFDVDTGILRFLRDELDNGIKLKIYETVVIQGFRLIEFVMEQFHNEYEPYIMGTKELCEFTMKIRCIHYIRKAAASVFKNIIKLFTDYELNLAETVENFGKTLHRYDVKERSEIFTIMAAIAKHNPSDVERFANAIFKAIIEDMKVQHKEYVITQSARFQEYFESLKDLMECFTPYPNEEKNKQYCEEVYKYIRHICEFDEQVFELNPGKKDRGNKFFEKKKAANLNTRLAVELLIRHWSFFGSMIYKDYKFWQAKFEYLLRQNGKTGELGWRAMKAFYKAIAQWLKNSDTNEERNVLLYFRQYFLNYLTRLNLNSSLLQLIVWAYSQMAAPCKKHLTSNEVDEMYTLISRRSISLYTRDDANIEEIYSYVESISEILIHLPKVSINQIKLLSKLGIFSIKRFPELKIFVQPSAIKSLIKSITNVGYLNQNLQQEYFYDLVYNGIMWSCSHTLYIDAELARSTLKERPICYKNYLPLWEEVFNLQYYKIETGPQVIKHLCKELFSTCISLMNTLNLQVQTKNDTMFSDVALSMTAENETDFRIFVNMVDLYEELLKKLDFSQIKDWLPKILYEIVKNSYNHPMVSGFYKLAHTILQLSDTYWKSLHGNNETFELMSRFLSNTLDLICGFYHELQIACVYLILDAPLNLVRDKLRETIPVFKIALTIGLSDFSLAACALDALEQWTRELPDTHPVELKEFLTEIIPSLEPYLQSKESETELLQDILKIRPRKITHVTLRDETKTLEEFQRRILLFLGSLSSEITQNFIHKSSQDTKATWDKKDLLEYTLFFPDHRLHIHFDKILPRVIELALSSGDRRTRMCACEVLHSMIIIILGKTRDIVNRPNPDRFAYLYKILCPAMLKLGSDSDLVVRQLYFPISLQLTHWLSSKLMLKSPSTIYLVDALFDGLTDESNSSLRDFSGLCLKEFLDWSIKQSSDRDLANSAINIHTIVRKICTYALHPSTQRRIAAAIAFNHLYSSLREREEILNIYWLEIFYCIVKSSEGFHDLGIENAIGHLEKVLKIKFKLFNAENSKRRKPLEFESGNLKSALIWLLTQCGSLDRSYRKSCMKLFENIHPFVEDCNRGEKLVSLYLKNHGIEGFNSIFLNKLNQQVLDISLESVKPLLRSLDCYIWFVEKRLIDFKLLFGNPDKELIFSYANDFIKFFMNRREIENPLLISKELEILKTLTCETIETLFSFCHKILNNDLIFREIPDYFWSQDLFALMSICVLNPPKMGFDTKNLKIMESLPQKMDELLNILKNSPLLEKFLEKLSEHVGKYYQTIINIEYVIDIEIEMEFKFNMKGFILLERRGYLDVILKGEFHEMKKKLIEEIFNTLQRQEEEGSEMEDRNKKTSVFLKPDAIEYLESVLELVLTNYEPSLINSLINFIMNDTLITNQDMTTSHHGEYFLSVFKKPIFNGMLKNVQESVKIMEGLLENNPDKLLMIFEELSIFTHRHKKNYPLESESLAIEILRLCTLLQRITLNFEHRRKQFMNIYRIVVRLKRNPLEITNNKHDLYLWILRKLQENIDLEKKSAILDDFLICLTDMNSNSFDVSLTLGNLKNDRPENIADDNINSLKASGCFQTMLLHLPLTKSAILFEAIIAFAAGSCEQLCNEKTLIVIENYFRSITSDHVLNSLDIAYKAFMNCGTLTARFDVLRKFLLPAFQFCKSFDIERFFEKNAKEIYSSLLIELKADAEDDLKRQIVSKIGSYNLFEIMFARVKLEKITSVESRIARNVFEAPEDKELMVKLLKQTLSERKTKCLHPNTKEITRLLHCSAYNCHISIISLKEEEKFYSWTFTENRKEGSLIWENIIDCEKQYSLKQTFKEYPKQKKKLINIKKRSRSDQMETENYSYIHKYNLASSTLVENVDSYDFNEATLIAKSDQTEETMSLTFECDDFNEHECMAPLSGILIHMVRNDICVPQDSENSQFPKWMGNFFRSMKTNYNNVRLFLLKVICNTQNIFKPYMKCFVGIILNTVNEYLKQNSLNYIITDVLLLLVEWQVSLAENHVEQAQILLDHLIGKADSIGNRSVKVYNVEIIRMILQLWGDKLTLPSAIDKKVESAPDFAIQLILTFLENKLQDQLVARADLVDFTINSFDDWKREEDVVLQNCAALGLIAKYLGNENGENGAEDAENTMKGKINEMLCSVFQKMQVADKSRLIKCINALASAYPPWIENFFEFVRSNIGKVDNLGKAKCLEIFIPRIPNLTVDEVKRELGYLNFSNLLKNKILTCEALGLEIIGKLVPIFNAGDMLELTDLVLPYLKNDSSELREKAYDIFIKIKNQYGNVSSIEFDENKLRDLSTQALLMGLLDSAENLHEKLINYWTEVVSQPEKLVDRLLDLLKQYNPDVEQVFLLYFCLSILRLTNKSKEYDEKIFTEKLEECSFVEYEIMLHWRAKNLGSIAPLFARSLASQMSQMFSQTFSQSSTFSSTLGGQLLRATVGPAFEPTALGDSTFSGTQSGYSQGQNSDVFKMPDPAFNKKSKRFLGQRGASSEYLQKNVKTHLQHDEMVKEEVVRQSNVVKLYRKYRHGDFPDIQISHSSLLVPLQELAKKDWLICKDLVVSLVCSLLNDMSMKQRNEETISEIFNRMKRILESNRGSSWTLAAVLEITLANKFCSFEPELVGRVSKTSGLYSLGALYLENYMIHDADKISEPPRKRRRDENRPSPEPSIYLARMYKSMNEADIVLSIFKSGQFSEKLQEASLAQSSGDFQQARKSYEEAYEMENGFVKEHCLQESFECLCQLSRWDVLDKKVFQASQEDFNTVWDDPEQEEWLLPWIYRVYQHKILKGDLYKNRDTDRLLHFLECVDEWIKSDKLPRIKRRFGEEMSNIFMIPENQKLEIARDYLRNSLDDARENWLRLNPLSEKLRSHLLLKLRGISSIDLFFKTLKSSNLSSGIRDLMKEWSQHLPSPNDDLLPWETHMNYRMYFATILMSKYETEDDENILPQIRSVYIQQKMKFLDFAIEHRNNFIAKNYVVDLEEAVKFSRSKKLEFQLSTAKCFHLMGEFTNDMTKKLAHIQKSWKYVHNHLQANESQVSLRISALQHVTTLTLFLENILKDGGESAEKIMGLDFSSKLKNQEQITDVESLRRNIVDYGLCTLKESCDIAESGDKAECYFKLVTHCYNRILRGGDVEEIREFVSATLKAMIHGSSKAAHYFPCLLKLEYLQDETTKEIFVQECEKIETWLFITWQSQIFSHLGGSFAEILIPIVERLVDDYPNAVMYNFRLTIESNPDLLTNRNILTIKEKLYSKPGVEAFLSAMHYVAQPELYFMHHLSEISKTVQQGKPIPTEKLLEILFLEKSSEMSLCGSLFKQVSNKIEIFRNEIESMSDKTFEEFKPLVKKIKDVLNKILKDRTENGNIFKSRLKDFSPWLQTLSGSDIEVPGQYSSNRKPLPRYHAKIGKIEPHIVVMHSLRKPIKLTIVGNDAKNYSFLVKFGEDLRNDQRIQQAFDIMNKILQNDISCAQRHLAIDTYQVIPFSLSLGLIVWIEGMRTLEDFIHFTLTEEQRRQCILNIGKYDEWIRKSSGGRTLAYKESLIKYSAKAVVSKMNQLINSTERDALRKTFFTLSPSVESFLCLRNNFVSTYGTMCTAQWIMGIGDRHLENLLISVKSGRCLGIDFGYAFGAGIDIKIPELMPFRLTPQIQDLFKPFAENGPFEATMVFVLKALRKEKGPLLACLDVFVHEPLNWLENINQFSRENQEEVEDVNWLPIKRVATVAEKLDGKKPSLITIEELKLVHGDQKYFCRYEDIVNGTEEDHKTLRAKIKSDNLTPEEQVQCLIDQASDFNILGRTFKGWQPWM